MIPLFKERIVAHILVHAVSGMMKMKMEIQSKESVNQLKEIVQFMTMKSFVEEFRPKELVTT